MYFYGLVALAAFQRLVELRYSKRNQVQLQRQGASKPHEPGYIWMVTLHCAWLGGSVAEVALLDRPFIPAVGWTALVAYLGANVLRYWVIRTLGRHWNTQVVDSTSLGVVTTGPYRLVRHPNYSALIVELAALPLVHTAWITALATSLLHIPVLAQRIRAEESVLHGDAAYVAAMGNKPRFLPL